MCGIAGFIGRSLHPEVTFELMTALFRNSEIRGNDASGFWGTEAGQDGRIIYHKEPVKATDFIKSGIWHGVKSLDLNLLVLHARGASQGSGHPFTNSNNHPFVSTDKGIAVVHNGRIPDSECDVLKKKYQVKSDCDSELLLRIFETAEATSEAETYDDPADWAINARLRAMRNIWSEVIKGHMAVAIGERLAEGQRRLWLFRNKYRSLWLVDMRQTLGQVIFCSTPEIWQAASSTSRLMRPFVRKKIKLVELPTEEIFVMRVGDDNDLGDGFLRRFDVVSNGFSTYEYKGDPYPVITAEPVVPVLTRLNEHDVVQHGQPDFPPVKKNETPSGEEQEFDSASAAAQFNATLTEVEQPPVFPWWDTAGQFDQFYTVRPGVFSPLHLPPLPPLTTAKDVLKSEPTRASHNNVISLKGEEIVFEEDDPPVRTKDGDGEDVFDDEDELDADALREIDSINDSPYTIEQVSAACKNIKHLVEEIETTASNKKMEGSIQGREFEELVESLEQTAIELQGTLQILEG